MSELLLYLSCKLLERHLTSKKSFVNCHKKVLMSLKHMDRRRLWTCGQPELESAVLLTCLRSEEGPVRQVTAVTTAGTVIRDVRQRAS